MRTPQSKALGAPEQMQDLRNACRFASGWATRERLESIIELELRLARGTPAQGSQYMDAVGIVRWAPDEANGIERVALARGEAAGASFEQDEEQ